MKLYAISSITQEGVLILCENLAIICGFCPWVF